MSHVTARRLPGAGEQFERIKADVVILNTWWR
jgi:hypothetical protein